MSRGKPFEVGNKAGKGRPKGSRNKKTVIMQDLLGEYGPAVVSKVISQALKGDRPSQRVLLPFILPRPKDVAVNMGELPTGTAEELAQSAAKIVRLMAAGKITPHQAQEIAGILEGCRRVLETSELDARVQVLEKANKDEFAVVPEAA